MPTRQGQARSPVASRRNNDRECRGPYYTRGTAPKTIPTSFLRLLRFLLGPRPVPLPLPLPRRFISVLSTSGPLFLFLPRPLDAISSSLPYEPPFPSRRVPSFYSPYRPFSPPTSSSTSPFYLQSVIFLGFSRLSRLTSASRFGTLLMTLCTILTVASCDKIPFN